MGLSSRLSDVSSESIPILLVAAAAGWVSYVRSLLHFLLLTIGLVRTIPPSDDDVGSSHLAASTGSGLAGLIALADHLNAARPFAYSSSDGSDGDSCVVCLCGMVDGDRVRRLSCRHVFHAECLAGWLDRTDPSCPLCRSLLAAPGSRAEAERRVAAQLLAWLPPPCYSY